MTNAWAILCTQYRKDDWHSRLGVGIRADSIMNLLRNITRSDFGYHQTFTV